MAAYLLRFTVLLSLLIPVDDLAFARVSPLPDPSVQVRRQDSSLILDISYQVPVQPEDAWATLTDFENQPGFIPNLEVSRVLHRSGNRLQLEQKGVARLGMLRYHYESQRELEFIPYQLIRSRSLSGDIHIESTLALIPAGEGTRLAYHVTAVSKMPVPTSLVASYLIDMLREQFKAMGQEMMRRRVADPFLSNCRSC